LSDPRLVTFVRNSLQKGLGRTEIEQALAQKGWTGVQVSEAFADAQSTAASGTSKTIAAASSGRTLYIILGVLMILFVAVGIAIVFWPSDDSGDIDECSSSRDCGSGYDCIGEECILSVDEDETTTRTTTTTIEEEEPECYFDSDCDDGYECSENYTCELEETTTTTTSNATSVYPNYLIEDVEFDYLSMTLLSLDVNVSNDEDSDTTKDMYLGCDVSNNVTSETYLSLSKIDTPESLDSFVDNCLVEVNGTLLYSTLLGKSPIKFTVNTTVDYYGDITETDEEDNSLITSFEVFEEDMTFVLPSIVCSTDSGCATLLNSSYECSSGYCATVVETATLSEDCSALTCESPYVCSSSNVCVECDDDTDCTRSGCDTTTNTCVSATSTIACDDSVDNDGDGLIDYRSGCDTDADGLIDYVCGTYDTAQNYNEGYTSYGEVDSIGVCDENWYKLEDDSYHDRTVLCGIDEDLDGSVISKDDGCSDALDISESSSVECSVDGDCGDGYKCVSFICEIAETCDDSVDNDGNSYIDCLDSDCDGSDGCEYGTEVTCDDFVDNDGDSKTDIEDSDCYECASNSECGDDQYCSSYECVDKTSCESFDYSCKPYACEKSAGYCYLECSSSSECASGFGCSNGECVAEEDIDCDCEDGYYCTETGGECTATKCNDGIDNDNDGTIDYADGIVFSGELYDDEVSYISCNDDYITFIDNYFDWVIIDYAGVVYSSEELKQFDKDMISCQDYINNIFDSCLDGYECDCYSLAVSTTNSYCGDYFKMNADLEDADSYCDENINANAEKEISSKTKLGAAELEQNIFMRIIYFVIRSNSIIDLFRIKN